MYNLYDILATVLQSKRRSRDAIDPHAPEFLSPSGKEAVLSAPPFFVAGDWGTSHLRLFLCRGEEVLERREGPGIAALRASSQATFFELASDWLRAHGRLPVYLSGMVGSRNGWKEAPYAPCPVDARSLAASLLRFDAQGHSIGIVPGVSCTNPHGAPDVMRGEETQIAGALVLNPDLRVGRKVVVLPGTHTKWVSIVDGRIVSFQTSLSGELFALLRDHSMLARAAGVSPQGGGESGHEREGFELGLMRSRRFASTPLPHLLFEVRSRQLMEGMAPAQGLGFLSGLIIGQDVLGGLTHFDGASASAPVLIGAPQLMRLYQAALAAHGVEASRIDADQSTLLGLRTIAALSIES